MARESDIHGKRIESTAIMQRARTYSALAHRWLEDEHESLKARATACHEQGANADIDQQAMAMDATEAMEQVFLVSWNHFVIVASLDRALREREDGRDGATWAAANESARIALISIVRSEMAWRMIARWTGAHVAAMLADQLAELATEVRSTFPDARSALADAFDVAAE